MSNPMGEGWKCPVCGKGNSPLAFKCGHCSDAPQPERKPRLQKQFYKPGSPFGSATKEGA